MIMADTKLNVCPFCGAPAIIDIAKGTSFMDIKVKCTKCPAMMHNLMELNDGKKEEAVTESLIKSWNKRT